MNPSATLTTFSEPSPRPLRILFVSSTTSGGSGRSQRELNVALRAAGAETLMLVDNAVGSTVTRFLHEQLWDASVRFKTTPVLGGGATWLRSIPGRHPLRTTGDILVSPAPENAFPDLAMNFQPDIVIGSSIARPAWREIRRACAKFGLPAVLYLREETALRHLEPGFGGHAAVLANSKTLVEGAERLGVHAHFVPSIVDVAAASTVSTRERILLVNPRRQHGVDIVESLATTFRTIEFVLQESWKLDPTERRHVDDILSRHPNVSFRPRSPSPSEVFHDAAIVIAPHQIDNRPRTILEALSNGIPVIANNLPGLVESVGPGGIIVDDVSGWERAINKLWKDARAYRNYEQAALRFAGRPEVQKAHVVTQFLSLAGATISAYRQHSTLEI